ncbi:hypothetical protein, partial [Prevotella sp. MGM1]|uniref:hypothetical protein n=1 Tax=Prevotella sp. MGM1 TaxID=2033405 RepID=UPI001E28EDAD
GTPCQTCSTTGHTLPDMDPPGTRKKAGITETVLSFRHSHGIPPYHWLQSVSRNGKPFRIEGGNGKQSREKFFIFHFVFCFMPHWRRLFFLLVQSYGFYFILQNKNGIIFRFS